MKEKKEIQIHIDSEYTDVITSGSINKLDIILSIAALTEQIDIETLDLLIKKLENRSKIRKKDALRVIK